MKLVLTTAIAGMLLLPAAFASADTTQGSVDRIDYGHGMIWLADGRSFRLPDRLLSDEVRPRTDVYLTYTTYEGQQLVTSIEPIRRLGHDGSPGDRPENRSR